MASQLLIKNKIETEKLIKIAIFKKDIRKTSPHKHNSYFEIIYLSKGAGYHYIDSDKYAVEPPVMYFIRQEQIHFWELETEPEGYVVIMKKICIEKSLDNVLKSLLTRISNQSCLQLTENKTIEELLQLLTEENATDDNYAFHVTEGLLKSLLAKH